MRSSDESSGMEYRGLVDVLRKQRRWRLVRWEIDEGIYDENAAIPTVVQKLADILDDGEPEAVHDWTTT